MTQEEFERSVREYAAKTFVKLQKNPTDNVQQEKEKLKDAIKKSLSQFEESTGVSVHQIEVKNIYSPGLTKEFFLTIHLSSLF